MSIAAEFQPPPALTAGITLPEVVWRNSAGSALSLSEFVSQGPAVLLFYRGAW